MVFGTLSGNLATEATTMCFLCAATQGRDRTRHNSDFTAEACPPFSSQLPFVANRAMLLRRSPWVSGAPDRAGSIIGMGVFAVPLQRLTVLVARIGPPVLDAVPEVGDGPLSAGRAVAVSAGRRHLSVDLHQGHGAGERVLRLRPEAGDQQQDRLRADEFAAERGGVRDPALAGPAA